MGYRHVVISQTLAPKAKDLPSWFVTKYENIIDFEGDYWRSYHEYKRYGALCELDKDIQYLINNDELKQGEDNLDKFQLVYFADEGLISRGYPDVSHVLITKCNIVEIKLAI